MDNNIYSNSITADIALFNAKREAVYEDNEQISFHDKLMKKMIPPKTKGTKTKQQLKKEESICKVRIIRILFITLIFLGCFVAVLSQQAISYELSQQISDQEMELKTLQSEEVSLHSQLDNKTSIINIAEYVTEKLNMIKATPNDITYIDVNEYKNSFNEDKHIEEKIKDDNH